MADAPPLIAPEIIACLREGREPTVTELCRIADGIEKDLEKYKPLFVWNDADQVRPTRLYALRLALLTLNGDPNA